MSLRATLPRSQRDLKPLQSLAKASAACSAQGTIYAECVLKAQFGEASAGVEKDICKKEFAAFKDCVQEKVSFNDEESVRKNTYVSDKVTHI